MVTNTMKMKVVMDESCTLHYCLPCLFIVLMFYLWLPWQYCVCGHVCKFMKSTILLENFVPEQCTLESGYMNMLLLDVSPISVIKIIHFHIILYNVGMITFVTHIFVISETAHYNGNRMEFPFETQVAVVTFSLLLSVFMASLHL